MHNLETKKIKRVANTCKGRFGQCTKTKTSLKYNYFPGSYHVLKMHNSQTIETPEKATKKLPVRTKLSVDARMIKTLTSPLIF